MKKKMIAIALALMITMGMTVPAFAATVTDFTDVQSGAWYYGAVEYAVSNKMVEGTSGTTFSPYTNMTRGQFVTILSRLEGDADFTSDFPASGYTDVPVWGYYYQHINWLKKSGISDVSGSTFRPDAPILRDELVIMLGKYLEYKGVSLPDDPTAPAAFKDADKISAAAKPYTEILRKCGMLIGDNGYLNPQSDMTRAEGVTVFMRIGQKIQTGEPTAPGEPETPDWENYNPTYDIPTGKSAADANGGYYDYDLANELMKQVNELRVENGVNALLYNPRIQEWASIRAYEASISFSHTRPDGSTFNTVGQGILSAENLLRGDDYTASWKEDIPGYAMDVVKAWYESTGHRHAMLNYASKLGAVSCYVKGDNVYIAHLFSQRSLYVVDFTN